MIRQDIAKELADAKTDLAKKQRVVTETRLRAERSQAAADLDAKALASAIALERVAQGRVETLEKLAK